MNMNVTPTLEELTNIIEKAYRKANPGWNEEKYQKFIAQIQKWYSKKYEG